MKRIVVCCLLLASISVSAGTLYKWKDANGVSHYSGTPPQHAQSFETISVSHHGESAVSSQTASVESPACVNARKNLELLSGSGKLMLDSNGDGKPDTPLDEAQRVAQKALAEAAIKANCTATPSH
ncbi:DUF4124 domain-containing protein [Xylella fastidiosa subsp. multiplex]|uniref:DUF4124 domain-containing protein n=1 Tax=Xylella fastidiosa subsp. multiplex TaxID=644357 RepID=A0A9Q4ML60_XYLFS|nr:DUF4124 domain-containing protein [Xylella fastidiosa]ERI61125.1 membrane protein [Xylella fastidiosa subsp. multiplex Griffin-1]KAF0571117.1 membrane protein [Xylella fastidiosa subsp. fastidiosa Mus-1]ACA12687.1 conserved hypothetical protein [Xylella fastidiosa M12]KAJ4853305.1 DUF4124 domain-containing protein [Xylella fastidiosa subsp. multiplex]KFA41349.1 hypothetical protein DF22_001928 [Xylella fastidiosa]